MTLVALGLLAWTGGGAEPERQEPTETEINWVYANYVEDPVPGASASSSSSSSSSSGNRDRAGNSGEELRPRPRSEVNIDAAGYVYDGENTTCCLGCCVAIGFLNVRSGLCTCASSEPLTHLVSTTH